MGSWGNGLLIDKRKNKNHGLVIPEHDMVVAWRQFWEWETTVKNMGGKKNGLAKKAVRELR